MACLFLIVKINGRTGFLTWNMYRWNNRNIYQYFQSQPTPEQVFVKYVLAVDEYIYIYIYVRVSLKLVSYLDHNIQAYA